jgi:hypothetical protein
MRIESISARPAKRHLGLFLTTSLATMACLPGFAREHASGHRHDREETRYRQINLVSDLPGVAQVQDTNLVNGWGISYHPTFPFWVSDNRTGKTTLYSVTNDASGAPKANLVPASAIGLGGMGPTVRATGFLVSSRHRTTATTMITMAAAMDTAVTVTDK